ncbi:unnamed protein product [Blepharisma stoltei]|uniref:ATP synthase F0 subunit 8 n=1 Tax=Blepharisma stoltei TaxID=1481888 RepID=A0AAU9JM91_9CILI|nr:unnamed protein product [Blepharisma stoltei]
MRDWLIFIITALLQKKSLLAAILLYTFMILKTKENLRQNYFFTHERAKCFLVTKDLFFQILKNVLNLIV